jgi:hypothetical protein
MSYCSFVRRGTGTHVRRETSPRDDGGSEDTRTGPFHPLTVSIRVWDPPGPALSCQPRQGSHLIQATIVRARAVLAAAASITPTVTLTGFTGVVAVGTRQAGVPL